MNSSKEAEVAAEWLLPAEHTEVSATNETSAAEQRLSPTSQAENDAHLIDDQVRCMCLAR